MVERGSVTRGEHAQITCAADKRNLTPSISKEDKYLTCASWKVILFLLLLWKQQGTKFSFDVKRSL